MDIFFIEDDELLEKYNGNNSIKKNLIANQPATKHF